MLNGEQLTGKHRACAGEKEREDTPMRSPSGIFEGAAYLPRPKGGGESQNAREEEGLASRGRETPCMNFLSLPGQEEREAELFRARWSSEAALLSFV